MLFYELILRQVFSRDLLDNWLVDVFLLEAGMAQSDTEFDKISIGECVEPFAKSFNETVGNCKIVPAWARKNFVRTNQLLILLLIRLNFFRVLLVEPFQNLKAWGHDAVATLRIYSGHSGD